MQKSRHPDAERGKGATLLALAPTAYIPFAYFVLVDIVALANASIEAPLPRLAPGRLLFCNRQYVVAILNLMNTICPCRLWHSTVCNVFSNNMILYSKIHERNKVELFTTSYSEFGRPALAALSATFRQLEARKLALSAASAGLPNSLLFYT